MINSVLILGEEYDSLNENGLKRTVYLQCKPSSKSTEEGHLKHSLLILPCYLEVLKAGGYLEVHAS